MLLYVVDIFHDGLALAGSENDPCEYWLPAEHVKKSRILWSKLRDSTEPEMPIHVRVTDKISSTPFGERTAVDLYDENDRELDLRWMGELHGLKIENISRSFIHGRIGSVKAEIKQEEYTAFLNCFPHNDQTQDHGVLALGDVIGGLYISAERDAVRLSFEQAMNRFRTECQTLVESDLIADHEDSAELQDRRVKQPQALLQSPPEKLSPLLFVENDPLCREAWSTALQDAGIELVTAGDYRTALTAIQDGPHYSSAILDIHLDPGMADYSGLELAEKLTLSHPDCRIILSSAEVGSGQKKIKYKGELPVHGYIMKPVLLTEWAAIIDASIKKEHPRPLKEELSNQDVAYFDDLELNAEALPAFGLVDALTLLRVKIPGITAHVFRLHPRSWRGTSVAEVGDSMDWIPYRGKLGKSVIKDAALQIDPVVNNASVGNRSHLWTQAMIKYQSFFGQRVLVTDHYHYVLVVFHPEAYVFNEQAQLHAQICTEQISRVLSIQRLQRHGVHDSEHASAGLGFACLAHEIYATLSGVEAAINRMQALIPTSGNIPAKSGVKLHRIATSLSARTPELVSSARILRGAAGGNNLISISFCLRRAVYGIRQAKYEVLQRPRNIAVVMVDESLTSDWRIQANAGALVTVFFNILLNAVQQIELFAAIRSHGWVRVFAREYLDEDGHPWAFLYFKDSGPGIHPDEWGRIFEAGHSTRENGTGLGLHICRQILSRIQSGQRRATVEVLRSTIWFGATVVVRLPIFDEGDG